jgi:hypothetical protein
VGIRIDRITCRIEWTEDFGGHQATEFSVDLPEPLDPFTRAVLEKNTERIKAAMAARSDKPFDFPAW